MSVQCKVSAARVARLDFGASYAAAMNVPDSGHEGPVEKPSQLQAE